MQVLLQHTRYVSPLFSYQQLVQNARYIPHWTTGPLGIILVVGAGMQATSSDLPALTLWTYAIFTLMLRYAIEATEPRILIVDESEINCHLVQFVFSQIRLKPDYLSNGYDAVEAHRENPYDLILIECREPCLPQLTAIRALRDEEFQRRMAQRVPIIGLTAFASPEFLAHCFDAGVDACFEKPFDRPQMDEILGRWLPKALHDPVRMSCPNHYWPSTMPAKAN